VDYQYQASWGYNYITSVENGDIVGHFGDSDYVTQESPDVYTVYARLKLRLHKNVFLKIRGEIEDDSIENSISGAARVTLVVRFR
jgi:hypothetical protein